ncbi:MAG: glycosyltransferase family 4 protein, partial [Clostridia bacterium]|nr:glycosyltransferase family 4 protein [Clostridia bacterium]
KGHEVVAIGNESEEAWREKFSREGIRYISAEISRNGTNPFEDIKTYRSLRSILAEEKPDRIFSFQAKTVIYGGLAAHKAGIKGYFPLLAGVGSVFLSRGVKASLIRAVVKAEYRAGLKHAEKVFFQNGDDVDLFVKSRMVKREQAFRINGSGVDLEYFAPQKIHLEPVFLFVGRLIRDKGITEYLDAAREVKKKYPSSRFLLVGPFDSNPSALKPADLQPYIDEGTVEYFGEQTDVRPYHRMSSVFVLPSYREGTPKATLEAMASARAVITTDAPGCRETVTDGDNGYLVPVRSVESLVSAMCKMIEDPDGVERMSLRGREIAEEKFDVNVVNRAIMDCMGL